MTPPVLGTVTRGTTARRRLRRVDRWLLAARPGLVRTPDLLVVDLGFGASSVTTAELAARLRRINPSVQVVGLDTDRARVERAVGGDFRVGGFELAGLRPHLVRAMNVLRQYDEADAYAAWDTMCARLAPGGLLVEGTCDEPGRLGAWVALDVTGPQTLTIAVDLDGGASPSAVAARLPKALIHHNVGGEPIHRFLADLDDAWQRATPVFGPRHRFAAAVAAVRAKCWPILDGPSRWRRGEATVSWAAVRPLAR